MGEGVQMSAMGRASDTLFSLPVLGLGLAAEWHAGNQIENAAKILESSASGNAYFQSLVAKEKVTSKFFWRRAGRALPFGKEIFDPVDVARLSTKRSQALEKMGIGGTSWLPHGGKSAYKNALGHIGTEAEKTRFTALLRESASIKRMGRGVLQFSTAAIAFDVGKGVADYFRTQGREVTNRIGGMGGTGFYDSNMAYTTRQRALRAIQMHQGGHRRALGNESLFIHRWA